MDPTTPPFGGRGFFPGCFVGVCLLTSFNGGPRFFPSSLVTLICVTFKLVARICDYTHVIDVWYFSCFDCLCNVAFFCFFFFFYLAEKFIVQELNLHV